MGKIAYRLKGHESFVPREGWITKGLIAVNNDPAIFADNYAADKLGVGTNMAKSIRYWLRTSGLTKDVQKVGTVLTPLGELIINQDLYLEKKFTLWILHANIARNFAQATSWNVFFNDFDLKRWRRDEMLSIMEEYISQKTGDLDLSERSLRDDCSGILSMYTINENDSSDPEDGKGNVFNTLGLIRKNGQYYERSGKTYEQVGEYAVLYVIADRLHEDKFLSIDEIVAGRDMPGKLFFMNRIQVNNALDALESAGDISVSRTAGLDVVYPTKELSSMYAAEKYYSTIHEDGEYIV